VWLLAGCRSVPVAGVAVPPESSLLAVDVLFPAALSRDPSLVQAFLLKGAIPDAGEELPPLIPATFVKGSRAYLLDAEPGDYSLAVVTAEYAPPINYEVIEGVTETTSSGISTDAMILPAELIRRTTTRVAPGQLAFMGALRVARGDRIDADSIPQDDLQRRIAEQIRPGVTSESGLRGWLKRARVVDLEETSLSNQPADRQAFLEAARVDLGISPWADVVARAEATAGRQPARPRAPARPAPIPEPVAVQPAIVEPRPAPRAAPPAEPQAAPQTAPEAAPAEENPEEESTITTAAIPEQEPLPVAPQPHPFAGVPPDSPLAQIEYGMKHDQVQEILGSPDGRIDRLTSKAWIPFYDSPGSHLREWIYAGRGRVVFSLYQGSLEVVDVVYDPSQEK